MSIPGTEKEHHAAIEEFTRNHGADHATTLSARNNLANFLFSSAKHSEAEKEHRAVLTLREKVLGAEDPATLSSAYNLAATLWELGKDEEALQVGKISLAGRVKILGEDHAHTRAALRFVEAIEALKDNPASATAHRPSTKESIV